MSEGSLIHKNDPPVVRTAKAVLMYVVLGFGAFIVLGPFLWMLISSFTPDVELMRSPPQLPSNPTLDQYEKALTQIPYLTYLRNSVIVAVLVTIGTVLSSSLGAYAFGILRWPDRDWLFIAILGTMMLPFQVTMTPLFLMFRWLGWIDTLLPLIVPAYFGSAFNIFLLRQFFKGLPRDLLDAARVDGCSEWRIYWRIVMPLSGAAVATVSLLSFLGAWNDFQGPLIYIVSEGQKTLALGLYSFVAVKATEWGALMAAAVMMMIPAIVLFVLAEKYFVAGIQLEGLKE
jgi:ABC-type glycerol-3-phosphate transport system permease component